MYILIGYRRFHSDKTNEDYCTASFISKLSKRDEKAGFIGQKISEIFLSGDDEFYDYLKPEHVGKKFNIMLGLDKEVVAMECIEK